ncbi:MAG TPA: ASPIC/UnbV domain-containing protein, partial [Blastocatellia bacterium]
VRSGGSYYSQNDLRVHFGLGKRDRVKTIEIRWPSGQVDTLTDVAANQFITVKEGVGVLRAAPASKPKAK